MSFDVLTNIATFSPNTRLALLHTYTASLSGTITDLSGNTLSPQSWSFSIRDGAWGSEGGIDSETDR